MAASTDQNEGLVRATELLRHGCWLVVLTIGVSALVLVVVGSIGLVGPVELTVIFLVVAVSVIAGDASLRRGRRRASRGNG